MPFPLSVREEALVKCGRHCCLCHRFVGTKIECHHIEPEADGGDDSLENCSAGPPHGSRSKGAYNPSHPKGTRFRPQELRAHRDKWHEKMSNTTPAIFDEERRAVDRAVYAKLRDAVPEGWVAEFLALHDWSQPIRVRDLDKIRAIDWFLDRLDSEFLDPTCEGIRATFAQAFHGFRHNDSFLQMSRLEGNSELHGLPKHWRDGHEKGPRELFDQCRKELNELSTAAYDAYVAMIRDLRVLLVVE